MVVVVGARFKFLFNSLWIRIRTSALEAYLNSLQSPYLRFGVWIDTGFTIHGFVCDEKLRQPQVLLVHEAQKSAWWGFSRLGLLFVAS